MTISGRRNINHINDPNDTNSNEEETDMPSVLGRPKVQHK